jgi:hypothetical protein
MTPLSDTGWSDPATSGPTLPKVSAMNFGVGGGSMRELQRPCGYCGHPVVQPGGTRRLLQYCGRSCRQRAYELRRAEARREADLQSGRVLAEPVERVVERIVDLGEPVPLGAWNRAVRKRPRAFAHWAWVTHAPTVW